MRRSPSITQLVFCIALLLGSMSAIAARADEKTAVLAVIVNAENRAKNMALTDIRRLFKLEQQFWPDGDRVVLLLRKTGSIEYNILLHEVYNMDEHTLRKHWVQKLFAGEIPAIPSTVKDTQSVIRFVQQSKSAIGVILADEHITGVRVLSIDGKVPGQSGYPLVVGK